MVVRFPTKRKRWIEAERHGCFGSSFEPEIAARETFIRSARLAWVTFSVARNSASSIAAISFISFFRDQRWIRRHSCGESSLNTIRAIREDPPSSVRPGSVVNLVPWLPFSWSSSYRINSAIKDSGLTWIEGHNSVLFARKRTRNSFMLDVRIFCQRINSRPSERVPFFKKLSRSNGLMFGV